MQNGKKSYRYEINDNNNSGSKQERIVYRINPNQRPPAEGSNKSLEGHSIQNRKPSQHQHSLHIDEPHDRTQNNRALRISKEEREARGGARAAERQVLYNQSQETIKIKAKEEESAQKNVVTAKAKQYQFKQPEWLKYRRRQFNNDKNGVSRPEEVNKLQYLDQDVHTTATNQELSKMRSESTLYQATSAEHIVSKQHREPELHESRVNLRLSRIQQYQITHIRLEQEVKELKYKLENLQEDNNILLGRMQTLEVELGLSHKKISQYAAREEYHRNMEAKLREKIEDLESKLVMAKDQINGKNELHDSGFNEGFSHFLNNDREVVQKKNQEISRLNQIVNKTRAKVNELNHQVGQERINNLQSVRLLEQKYETVLERKENQIKELRRIIDVRKERVPFHGVPQSRRVTENNNHLFPRANNEEQLKRVVSANMLHQPFIKYSS